MRIQGPPSAPSIARPGSACFASAFQMSWIAFQLPFVCIFQLQTYFHLSFTVLPSGPLYEASYVPVVKPRSPLFETSAWSDFHEVEKLGLEK